MPALSGQGVQAKWKWVITDSASPPDVRRWLCPAVEGPNKLSGGYAPASLGRSPGKNLKWFRRPSHGRTSGGEAESVMTYLINERRSEWKSGDKSSFPTCEETNDLSFPSERT